MFDIPTLLILIPALPLAATVITAVLGPKLLREWSHLPTIVALVGSFLLSFILVLEVRSAVEEQKGFRTTAVGWEETVDLWQWAAVRDASGHAVLDVTITLRADALSALMLVMVTFISSLIAIYSAGYMHNDRSYWRFFTYMPLFVFSMTMLVSVSNFVLLYVFWEAVGVCSYLLIGFWYEKRAAAAAGKKAFLVNRIGDFGFVLGLFLIWTTYGTLNFHDTGSRPDLYDNPVSIDDEFVPGVLGETRLAGGTFVAGGVGLAICLLLLVGACGKSAQFPLHVWLPDAMEGPTPVSALIHAATMVTAGVYMVTRCAPLFMVSETAQMTVAVVGGFTALMAGIIAFTQTDLKRILAYSTISQLGYMFLGLGTGTLVGITAGMFHLFTHAFFKALLFLGAGSVMHAMGGVIDIRRFGGLWRLMPITCATFLVGCLALSGVWPFAGFYSKDAIIAAVYDRADGDGLYLYLAYAAFFTAFLTAMYTFRAFFLTFFGTEEIPAEAGHHAHESPASMTVPLVVLAVGAVCVGWFMASFGSLLESTPSVAYVAQTAVVAEHAAGGSHSLVATVSTVLALSGVALAAFFYLGGSNEIDLLTRLLRPVFWLSHNKFFFDQIYTLLIVWPCLQLAKLSYWIDEHLVDSLVNFVGRVPPAVGMSLRSMQTGMVQFYAMLMVLGVLALVGSLFL